MIVPSIETDGVIGPDIPEEVTDHVTGYSRLENGTYRLRLSDEYREARQVETETRLTRLLEALEESTVAEIREVAEKVDQREADPDPEPER